MKAFFLAHPAVSAIAIGALSGWASAAKTDRDAFKSWKGWQDALSYNWGTATFRWFQGAIIGGLTASPIGYLLS